MNSATASQPAPTTLHGQLSDLRYHDPQSGNTAFMLVGDDGMVQRAFGRMRSPIVGEVVTLNGRFSRHSGFGRTFTFDTYLSAPPSDQEAQAQYLSRGG